MMTKTLRIVSFLSALLVFASACNKVTFPQQKELTLFQAIQELQAQVKAEVNSLEPFADEGEEAKNSLNNKRKPKVIGMTCAQLEKLLKKTKKNNEGLAEEIAEVEPQGTFMHKSECSVQKGKFKLRYQKMLETILALKHQIAEKEQELAKIQANKG